MTIAEWLQNAKAPYYEGMLLFKRHADNPILLSLFESGENSFTRNKLRDELKKLITEAEPKPKVTIDLVINARPKEPTAKQPNDVLGPIIQLKSQSFKEMAALHAQLLRMPNDAERFEAAQKIFELDSVVDECWNQINYFNEHGHLPATDDDAQLNTIGDVVRLAKNVPTYISKLNARLKSDALSDELRDELIAKKANWQIVLTKIDALLNEPIPVHK